MQETQSKLNYCGSILFPFSNLKNINRLKLFNRFIFSKNVSLVKPEDSFFLEWLAGLIDGKGSFLLNKKGLASLEIVMNIQDKHCLYLIKNKFGGSVKLRSGAQQLRYRLHHKSGLLLLIKSVNGLIRNPIRLLQLGKILAKYNLELNYPTELTYNNGWLSGFFDAIGSIYMNTQSGQVFITVSNKNKLLLDPLQALYAGQIFTLEKLGAFKWTVLEKEDILSLLNDYFKSYPSRSAKSKRLKLLTKNYELIKLQAQNSSTDSVLGKA